MSEHQKSIEFLKQHFPHHWVEPKLDPSVFVASGAHVIGDVEIGKDSSLWFNTVVRADVSFVRIGERTNIQDCSLIHESYPSTPCIIGNGVTVGHSVILHACTIADGSLIGMGSVLLDGVEVGSEVLIGAGSLVTQGTQLPPRTLVFGRPAKVIRELNAGELARLKWNADHYVRLSQAYLLKSRG